MITRLIIFTLLLLAAPLSSSAQILLPPDSATTVADVMDRMVEAMGGEAGDRVHTEYIRAHSRIPNTKLVASMEIWWQRPNLFYMTVELPIVGRAEYGFDGDVCWKRLPTSGPSILEGDEAADMLLELNPDRFVHWRDLYLMAELIGSDDVLGEACDVVLLVPDGGHSQDLYISRTSGLPVKMKTNRTINNATLPVTFYLSDYRETDGLLAPWNTLMEVMGETQTVQIERITHNEKPPKDTFKLPRDIRALAELSRD